MSGCVLICIFVYSTLTAPGNVPGSQMFLGSSESFLKQIIYLTHLIFRKFPPHQFWFLWRRNEIPKTICFICRRSWVCWAEQNLHEYGEDSTAGGHGFRDELITRTLSLLIQLSFSKSSGENTRAESSSGKLTRTEDTEDATMADESGTCSWRHELVTSHNAPCWKFCGEQFMIVLMTSGW